MGKFRSNAESGGGELKSTGGGFFDVMLDGEFGSGMLEAFRLLSESGLLVDRHLARLLLMNRSNAGRHGKSEYVLMEHDKDLLAQKQSLLEEAGKLRNAIASRSDQGIIESHSRLSSHALGDLVGVPGVRIVLGDES